MNRGFLKAGHLPTLFAAFLYFDLSFAAWVLLGALGVVIAKDLDLDAAHKGLMVATPTLAGAAIRALNGVLVDHVGPKRIGILNQMVVIGGLAAAWYFGIHDFTEVLLVGVVLGFAGASFAVALPLASRWYPPEHQGTALGIAGAGNSGTVLAALFAPTLAVLYGWTSVLGMMALLLSGVLLAFVFLAKEGPNKPAPKPLHTYLAVLRLKDAWCLMLLYSVTFGGFVGLASSLSLYFNGQYGLDNVSAGYCTAACVFAGSMVRPVGGALADRIGGVRTLTFMYMIAVAALTLVSVGLPQIWMALATFVVAMLALGAGNGAVFQLVPQRFGREIGVMTGLVGMTGGIGGFALASSLGYSKQFTGNYQIGFLLFVLLGLVALGTLTGVKQRWRAHWGSDQTDAVRV